MSTVTYCPDCHRMEGISCACHISIVDKIKTLELSGAVTASRTKRDYYDDTGLQDISGLTRSERREQALDGSRGHGYITSKDRMTPQVADDLGFG